MITLLGFSPDLPPETEGVMTDCANVLPDTGGFISAPSAVDAGLGAVNGKAVGFAAVRKIDGTSREFAGTASKLYEATSSWNDVSKVGGYSLGVDDRWRFAQFGNKTIAAAKSETMQASTSGAFANLSASAPKAAIVETINNQVFAFNTNDTSFGDDSQRWWCSAINDETDWVPSVNTQCVSGQLRSSPGAITAGRRLGDVIVAYKKDAIYVGQYVGTPNIWSFNQIPGNVGSPSHEAVVTTGTAHYFVGNDDFYVFDGSRAAPLNTPLRQWFFDTLDDGYSYRICGTFDSKAQRLYWWFPSKSSGGALDKCVVLHLKTGQWGRMDGDVEIAATYVSAGVTYDSLGTLYATYDDLPTTVSFDSPFWSSGNAVVSAFKTDHKAYTFTGVSTSSSITPGHHGSNTQFSTVSRVKPRFLTSPASSQLLYSYSNTDATTFSVGSTSTWANQWYDLLWSARWHKFEMQFTGNMKLSGYDIVLTEDGVQ